MALLRAHFILFVSDQAVSTAFYTAALGVAPTLNVPGMTELPIPGGAVLGLMPAAGKARLFGTAVESRGAGGGARAELYLLVDDPALHHALALAAGAREISPLELRGWGHVAAYSVDPDGHILAFAREG